MSKDALASQLPLTLPPPLLPSINLLAPIGLKKRKKDKKVVEDGELVLYDKGVSSKQLKMTKGKGRAFLVESKVAEHVAEVRHPAWNPRLELDGTTIPWNSSIREFQRGNAHHVVDALEWPLLLPKDMDALKNIRQ